jgi:Tfp pilus assembly protein PilN
MENPYWYLPEASMFILSLVITWFAVQANLDYTVDKITELDNNIVLKSTSLSSIRLETSRYSKLDGDIENLNEKLNSLQKITVSKIARFKPVILMEHLQNLKPDGVWFSYISDNTKEKTLTVIAKAFDSILIAEFMSALKATQSQVVEDSDLRTQVYFDRIRLERVATTGFEDDAGSSGKIQTFVDPLQIEVAGSFWTVGDGKFPEMKKFPSFQLTISYSEREAQAVSLSEIEL